MTNEDTAIAAQMREWLKEQMRGKFWSSADVICKIIDHLDTLTSKRWRVVEAEVQYTSDCDYVAITSEGTDAIQDCDEGTRVLIVTEEEDD